mgnify:CR=1 FL=1
MKPGATTRPLASSVTRPRALPASGLTAFAALWALPGMVFCVAVHIAKFGYTLPAVPVACLVLAFYYADFTSG